MLAIVLYGVFAGAASAASSSGMHQVLVVTLLDSGHLQIQLDGNDNTEGCATAALKNFLLVDKANSNFKNLYAMALVAMTTGRPLSAWVNGCTDVWGDGSTVIVTATRFDLYK